MGWIMENFVSLVEVMRKDDVSFDQIILADCTEVAEG